MEESTVILDMLSQLLAQQFTNIGLLFSTLLNEDYERICID